MVLVDARLPPSRPRVAAGRRAASRRSRDAGRVGRCSTRRRRAPPVYRQHAASSPASRFERWQGDARRATDRGDAADAASIVGVRRRGERWSRIDRCGQRRRSRARCSANVRWPGPARAPGQRRDGSGFADAAPAAARRRSARSSRATMPPRSRCSSVALAASPARSSSTSPTHQHRVRRRARRRGFVRQRPFVRMALGRRRRLRRRASALSSRSPGPSSADGRGDGCQRGHRPARTRCARACSRASRSRRIRSRSTRAPLDRRRQRALARYYLDAGARRPRGRRAHDPVRDPRGRPVRGGAAHRRRDRARLAARSTCATEQPLLVAGACGPTQQAIAEARLARGLGYDAVPAEPRRAARARATTSCIAHCSAVAAEMPLIGFYLQPAVGGPRPRRARSGRASRRSTTSSRSRSRRSTAIARSTSSAASSRPRAEERVALYTGNDDHIVLDLIDAVPRSMRDGTRGDGALSRRPARPLVGLDARRGRAARALQGRGRAARRGRRGRAPSCSRSTAASPTATAPSSTSPTTFAAASPAATRCCAARACSKASGASIRTRA